MAPPKKKSEKMAIGAFLQDQSLGSWADEMEEQGVMPLPAAAGGKPRTTYGAPSGSGFSGSDRFAAYSTLPPRQELPLPTRPPFTAHIGNLAFDVTDREIKDYFIECEVTSVRVVEDKIDRKPKGFGYIEFATVDGLKKALELNNSQFANRTIRVSIAEPPKDRDDRGPLDWSRKATLPEISNSDRRISDRGGLGPRSFSRNLDAASDAGSEISERRRPGYEPADGKIRDFSNWERKGPLQPRPSENSLQDARPHSKEGFDRFERRGSPRDSPSLPDRSLDGSRPPRREFRDRPAIERPPTAADADSEWRKGARPDQAPPVISRDNSTPSSPAISQAPASRPKLNLQKRSDAVGEIGSPADVSDSKSSPFGAARPADTAARDKAVADKLEEKKQEALKERKAAEEKKIADDKAAIEKKLAERKDRDQNAGANGQQQPRREIMRKESSNRPASRGPTDPMAKTEQIAAPVNGNASSTSTAAGGSQVDSTKPQEVVRDIGSSDAKSSEASANGGSADAQDAGEGGMAESMEEEGWSTVSKPGKNGKRASRAPAMAKPIAS